MLSARLITDAGEAAGLEEGWDALAVELGRPFCAPAWMLSWWRHAAPPGAALRVVGVHDGPRLVGIAPWYVQDERSPAPHLRLLCAGFTARIEPLAAPGFEDEVARLAAEAVAPAGPAHLRFEGIPPRSRWAERTAERWPGRGAWRVRDFAVGNPVVEPGDDYAAWLRSKSKNFRKESGRIRRRIGDAGATVRRARPEDVDRTVADVLAVYRARWDPRGGSARLSADIEAMLIETGRRLAPLGRFDAFLLEHDGVTVGAELFVRAGAESAAWGGGFVPAWARYAPSITLMLAGIEHAAATGVERVELGEGDQRYKQRFADADEGLVWASVLPRGRGLPRAALAHAPHVLKWRVRDRLTPEQRTRLKRLLRRERAQLPGTSDDSLP